MDDHKLYLLMIAFIAFTASYLFRNANQKLTPEQKAIIFDARNAQYNSKYYLLGVIVFFGGLYLLLTLIHLSWMMALFIMLSIFVVVGLVRNILLYRKLKAANIPQSYLNAMLGAGALIYFALIVYIATQLLGNPALAATQMRKDELNQNISRVGMSYSHIGTIVNIIINQEKAINAVPMLVNQKIISYVPPTVISKMPLALSVNVIGITFTALIVATIYDVEKESNQLQVNGYVLPPASAQQQLCYSFTMTREEFNKLNYSQMTPFDFIRQIPSFTFSDWCDEALAKETT